jgi:hypothetical protein
MGRYLRFRGRLAVSAGVGGNKGEILPLPGRVWSGHVCVLLSCVDSMRYHGVLEQSYI